MGFLTRFLAMQVDQQSDRKRKREDDNTASSEAPPEKVVVIPVSPAPPPIVARPSYPPGGAQQAQACMDSMWIYPWIIIIIVVVVVVIVIVIVIVITIVIVPWLLVTHIQHSPCSQWSTRHWRWYHHQHASRQTTTRHQARSHHTPWVTNQRCEFHWIQSCFQ